jgi:hypothetical protein
MTGESRMFIVNTGDVLDEVDRIVDEGIQSARARIDWLRWIGLMGPLVGIVGTIQYSSEILGEMVGIMQTMRCFCPPSDPPLVELLLTTAAGLVMALVFLPAHYILRNRATVLLLGIREKVKALFVRTRPPRNIGHPIVRSGPQGGMSRVRQYMTQGLRFTFPNVASIATVFLILSALLCYASDNGKKPPPVRLPSAQPIDDVDVRAYESHRLVLTLRHLHRDEMPCVPSDDPTNCRDETHWRINSFQFGRFFPGNDFSDPDYMCNCLISHSSHAPAYTSVFLRADAAAPFGLVRRVVEACRQAGIKKIEFGVALPPPASPERGAAQDEKGGAR